MMCLWASYKKIYENFYGILIINEGRSRIWIRIRTNMSRIPNTALSLHSTDCHDSTFQNSQISSRAQHCTHYIRAQGPRAELDNGERVAEPFQPPVLRIRHILYRTQIFPSRIPDPTTKKRRKKNVSCLNFYVALKNYYNFVHTGLEIF